MSNQSTSLSYFIRAIALRECQSCGEIEERVFTDSWTGTELCLQCLHQIAGEITMSPASDGRDNLKELLRRI